VATANHGVYSDPAVVRFYGRQTEAHAGELAMLSLLSGELPEARVLDIGVGTGRTTAFLAPRVKHYSGIDVSAAMIAAARERFAGTAATLDVGDARALSFEDASFDVVLFSYNGIDYVEHPDRIRILEEVRRVVRPKGAFFFSTHNLARGDLQFEAPSGGLLARLVGAVRRSRLRRHNPAWRSFASRPHALIKDGAYGFRLTTYHIRLRAQLEQLAEVGFTPVVVLGRDASELAQDSEALDAPWFHVLCRPT
jgi:SAM-dependent methyltransferase